MKQWHLEERVSFCLFFFLSNRVKMIDLIIAYLALIVVVLLFIIVFLSVSIVQQRRRISPLISMKTGIGPSGDQRIRNDVKLNRFRTFVQPEPSSMFIVDEQQFSRSIIDQ